MVMEWQTSQIPFRLPLQKPIEVKMYALSDQYYLSQYCTIYLQL